MPTRHRYFFALRPDAHAAERIGRLTRALVRRRPELVLPMPERRLHVSLNSLVVDEAPMHHLAARAARVVARVRRPPFVVAFNRVAMFGKGDGLRPAVLHGDEGVIGVDLLQSEIQEALADARLGPRRERPFAPHLTLARGACDAPEAVIAPIAWTVREFVLIHSRVGEGRHDIVGRFPLTA